MFQNLIGNPRLIIGICVFCIVLYYLVSAVFIWGHNRNIRYLKKGHVVDVTTSISWILCSILLVFSLFYLCVIKMTIELDVLVIYYFLFIFLFAIIYALIDWHNPQKMFDDVDTGSWKAELQYLLISIQTQATLGYTSSKPKVLQTEILTSFHSLLGMFFLAIFISLSINKFVVT